MAKVIITHLKENPTELEIEAIQEIKDSIMMRMPLPLYKYIEEEDGQIIITVDEGINKIEVEVIGFEKDIEEQIMNYVSGSIP